MQGGEVRFNFKGDDSDLTKKTDGLASKLGSAGATIGKAFVAGTAVVGTALTGMVASSVKAYADMEQNVGGVKTLFGTEASSVEEYAASVGKSVGEVEGKYNSLLAAQKQVFNDANNAYKTAGLSANEYMNTVTSFSASLISSLNGDTEAAAKASNQAIIDMSDNANKMGTSMEAIQNAYQGFAKQNYTMLDNLKLGYGGTKTEMERLLADATKISGIKYDIDNLSDVYNAIHVIQENLDITGTTAKEASSTISGSIGSAKASFENFLSGTGSIEDVISTFITAGTNIGNAIVEMAPKIIQGIVDLINGLMPQLPTLINTLMPVVLDGIIKILQGIVQAMPTLIQMILELLPGLIQGIILLVNEIIKELPTIITMIADMLPTLMPMIVDGILQLIPILIDNLPLFIKAGYQLLLGIAVGILNSVPSLLRNAKNIVISLWNYFNQLPSLFKDVGGMLIKGLWEGISNLGQWVINKIKGLGSSILKSVKNIFGVHSPATEFAFIGRMNMEGLIEGTEEMKNKVYDSYGEILDMNTLGTMFDLNPSLYGTTSNNLSPNVNVVVNNNMEMDPLGQMVNKIKTFSGGSKNDYNWGAGV